MNDLNNEKYTKEDIDSAITKLRFNSDCSEFKTLVSKGFDINHKQVLQIIDYIDLDLKAIVELVSLGFNLNTNNNLQTPLIFNLVNKNFDVESVKLIANLKGINLNVTNFLGNSILFELNSMCEDYIEDSLDEEATLNKKDKIILPILKVLIESNIDYSPQNLGESLLNRYREYPNILAYLFSLNIDFEYRCRNGMTAFLNFCSRQREVEDSYGVTNLWLTSGVDIYTLNSLEESNLYGFNALMIAIKGQNIETVKILLNQNFDINYRSPKGYTALIIALDTMNREVIDLIQEQVVDPYSDLIVIEKTVKLYYKEQNWKQVIEWGNKVPEEHMTSGETLNLLSSAYKNIGNMDKSLCSIKRAIELFELDNYTLDKFVLALLHAGEVDELVSFWYNNRNKFKPDQGEAANIIANLIVAFDQAGKSVEAITEFAPLLDKAGGAKESKRGLINFNLACMYGKNGSEIKAVEQIVKALEGAFVVEELSDQNFDNIRDGKLFNLLNMLTSDAIYFNYLKGVETNTIYTRNSNDYDSIVFSNNKYITTKKTFESTLEMLIAISDEKNDLLNKGFRESRPNFIDIWLPVFDSIFKDMGKTSLKPLTEFRMEWDFCLDDDQECNPFVRPYYCYSKEGYNNDGYNLLYIPQQKSYASVMNEVINLESFKILNKSKEVKLIQSEHDSGDEFEYIWSEQ